MTHLWVRAESRENEERVGVMPDGVAALIASGIQVTVEISPTRVVPIEQYQDAGAMIAKEGSWVTAPDDAIIFGLKELPDNETPLRHRHIMFGHAYKGQPAGQKLLSRFKSAGGTLYDLEYLENSDGRRVAAFGYWAGYAGAAVSLLAYAAQNTGPCPPVSTWTSSASMRSDIQDALDGSKPTALVIGALGRVGTGASDLCEQLGLSVTKWDIAETQHGGPFPEILQHNVFFNCILARPGTPVFVPADTCERDRALQVVGDIACDPDSDFSPIKVYEATTSWGSPVTRACQNPPLDVMAIDNLPSLLPHESSVDFSGQLLPHLKTLTDIDDGVWGRAKSHFDSHSNGVNS